MSNHDDRTDVQKKVHEFWKEVDDSKKRLDLLRDAYDPAPDKPIINGTGKYGSEQTYRHVTTDIETPMLDGAQRAIKEFVDMLAEEDEPQNGPVDNLFSSKKSSSGGRGVVIKEVYIEKRDKNGPEVVAKREQVGEQKGNMRGTSFNEFTDSETLKWGEMSGAFDDFMRSEPQPHRRRDVAEVLGVRLGYKPFYHLVQRRVEDKQIKILSGDRIQWVIKDWIEDQIIQTSDPAQLLDLSFPFNGESVIKAPEGASITIAGVKGSGKTHYGFEIGELNIDKMSVRHFINEGGSSRALLNLQDYPKLTQALGDRYRLVDQSKRNLSVADNVDESGLNVYDYLRITGTDEQWWYMLLDTLAEATKCLTTGVIVVFMQRLTGKPFGLGGEGTGFACDIYLTMEKARGSTKGILRIEKCRNWANPLLDPETLQCDYRSVAPRGKLVADGNRGWYPRAKEDRNG